MSQSHIIVVGNEKGGVGKTTISIHLIIYLLKLGFRVACIDIDLRQKTLMRYIENRVKYCLDNNKNLAMPDYYLLQDSALPTFEERAQTQKTQLIEMIKQAHTKNHFIIIDSPGNNTPASELAHANADTLITPVNDSFIDVDVLGQVDPSTLKIIKPSFYSSLVWQKKMEKAREKNSEINWIVLRNRVSSLNARNKEKVADVLSSLSSRLGFKIAHGFSERVIFRELFLHGLTLLDLSPEVFDIKLTMSHIAAKQELKNFLTALAIDKINQNLIQ